MHTKILAFIILHYFIGRICIPSARAKNLNDEYKGIPTKPVKSKGSFIDQLMEQAERDQLNQQASIKVEHNILSKQISMDLPNLNTDEILDLAHNMNTENIDNISMKLSESLKLSTQQAHPVKNTSNP